MIAARLRTVGKRTKYASAMEAAVEVLNLVGLGDKLYKVYVHFCSFLLYLFSKIGGERD